MRFAGAAGTLPSGRLTPARVGSSRVGSSPGSWPAPRRPGARHAWSPVPASFTSPVRAKQSRRPVLRLVLRLGVNRPRPPGPIRSNRRRRALRTKLAAPARPGSLAGDARFLTSRRRRQARRSGASHEVWSPTALAGRGASCSGGCHTSRTHDPASAFSPPARALVADRYRWRPPVRFCARGGVRRCVAMRGVFRSRVWRLKGDEPTVLRTVAKLLKTVHTCNDRARVNFALSRDSRVDDRSSTSLGAGTRLPGSGRVIRRGRFSHAAFRARDSRDPPRPGRTARFFPRTVRRRSWGCALRRFVPVRRVDARTVRSAAHHELGISAGPGPRAS
jgi:hypothetical protein